MRDDKRRRWIFEVSSVITFKNLTEKIFNYIVEGYEEIRRLDSYLFHVTPVDLLHRGHRAVLEVM
jgi:hypothetical protein